MHGWGILLMQPQRPVQLCRGGVGDLGDGGNRRGVRAVGEMARCAWQLTTWQKQSTIRVYTFILQCRDKSATTISRSNWFCLKWHLIVWKQMPLLKLCVRQWCKLITNICLIMWEPNILTYISRNVLIVHNISDMTTKPFIIISTWPRCIIFICVRQQNNFTCKLIIDYQIPNPSIQKGWTRRNYGGSTRWEILFFKQLGQTICFINNALKHWQRIVC
jgi:hypothetical protein